MGRIKQLSNHEAQKIAAGEVVDRPANVIKELVENALDANATHITVWIEDGGKELMRVRDNGQGMSAQDARMCILNHATSKITSIEDLETINTFGFRGEALASITSVTRATLTTQEPGELAGVTLTIAQGNIIKETVAAGPTGTDIILRDLFYNIPARKKFLKARDTEWRAIQHYFFAVCLSYETVDFQLYHEQKLILNCPKASNKQERLAQIFENNLTKQMLSCASAENSSFSITGFISGPHYARYDRNQIFLFVNNRWIKNHKLSQALLRGYHNCLPVGRFPAATIFITIDPHLVDINIHPRKEEVQFLHPRIVEVALETLVKKRLEQQTSERLYQPTETPHPISSTKTNTNAQNYTVHIPPLTYPPTLHTPIAYTPYAMPEKQVTLAHYAKTFTPAPKDTSPAYTLLGNLHATYMQLETAEGLVLVDQHAAHERILYEEYRIRFQNEDAVTLITPEIITLSQEDCALLLTQQELFQKHAIVFEQIGPQQLAVVKAPLFLKNIRYSELCQQVLSWIYTEKNTMSTDFFKIMSEKLRAQMACKAAVKAGDHVTIEATHKLIADLYATEHRFTCPHGRPTSWLITKTEIERKFKR